MSSAERGRRTPWWGAAAVGVVGVAAVAGWSVCPLQVAFGLDCPLCGGTRAALAVARGDLAAAVDHNVFVMTAAPAFVVAAAVYLIVRAVRPELAARVIEPAVRCSALPVLALTVAFGVVRNLPFAWAEPLRAT